MTRTQGAQETEAGNPVSTIDAKHKGNLTHLGNISPNHITYVLTQRTFKKYHHLYHSAFVFLFSFHPYSPAKLRRQRGDGSLSHELTFPRRTRSWKQKLLTLPALGSCSTVWSQRFPNSRSRPWLSTCPLLPAPPQPENRAI